MRFILLTVALVTVRPAYLATDKAYRNARVDGIAARLNAPISRAQSALNRARIACR